MAQEKYILFNVDIVGSAWKRGTMIPYLTAPKGPRLWCDGKHIQGDKRICFLVDANREPIEVEEVAPEHELSLAEKNQMAIDDFALDDDDLDFDDNGSNGASGIGMKTLEDYMDDFDTIVDKKAMTKNDRPRCWGITISGTQCERAARQNNRCMAHQDQANRLI
uniref:Uncharacterized protein n=1 Tax=viral metagenome TaxID=1070528 RepID=A0A6H1ZXM2_9ZZZZ